MRWAPVGSCWSTRKPSYRRSLPAWRNVSGRKWIIGNNSLLEGRPVHLQWQMIKKASTYPFRWHKVSKKVKFEKNEIRFSFKRSSTNDMCLYFFFAVSKKTKLYHLHWISEIPRYKKWETYFGRCCDKIKLICHTGLSPQSVIYELIC